MGVDPTEDSRIYEFRTDTGNNKKRQKITLILTVAAFIAILALLFIILLIILPVRKSEEIIETNAQRLQRLLKEDWEWTLRHSPNTAIYSGAFEYAGKWPNMSLGALESRKQHIIDFKARIEQEVDRKELPKEEQLNYDLILYVLRTRITSASSPQEYLQPITQIDGPQISIPTMGGAIGRSTKAIEVWISLLEDVQNYLRGTINLMREGMSRGIVLPVIITPSIPDQILSNIPSDLTESPLLDPVRHLNTSHPLYQKTLQAIESVASVAFQELHDFFVNEYIPSTRTTIGIRDVPGGEEYYRFAASYFTTVDKTPGEIHDIGLSEVKRIRAEMEEIAAELNHTNLSDLFEFVRTDPQFKFTSEDDMLRFIRDVAKRADAVLPKYFKTLPRCPYGVVPIPTAEAPVAPAAYYMTPDPECTRAGFYYVNTYDLPSRPKIFYISTTLHESVPGHHLHLALQREIEDLPDFRKLTSWGAYTEGWALYTEYLGVELGFYEDNYFLLGRLGDEMLRACRLVVDTGMHSMNWTRDEAIEYLLTNTPQGELDIISEVDRYISWPGQALGYKIGELVIKELRFEAEQKLKGKFDLRDFHQVILGKGSLPLPFVESSVKDYIASRL